MSRGSGPREFRLRRSVLLSSLCLAVSLFANAQISFAADTAQPATEPAKSSDTATTASAETPAAGITPTAEPAKEPELPNVDHLLGDDPSATGSATDGLSGSVSTTTTINETAMVTAPPKVVPAAKPAPSLPPMAQVKLHYKQGKYLDGLKVLATMKPTELTHYYAGLCYQGQGQLQKAGAEFGYVASIAKDPLIKWNANQALTAVSSYARSRTYAGQGNAFARAPSGGGGGSVRRG